jgi:hypothetical protein
MVSAKTSLGLPALRSIDGLPHSSADRLLLLLILGAKGGAHRVEMSQRRLTVLSSRSDNSRVAHGLRRLKDAGFLHVDARDGSGRGKSYSKGPKLRRGTSFDKKVSQLARTLFGPDGYCAELIGRSAFGFGFLNLSGCVVVGVLSRCSQPVEVSVLKAHLTSVISPSTTGAAIKRLVDAGIAVVDGKFVSLVDHWQAALEAFEERAGSEIRVARRNRRFSNDRQVLRLRHGRPIDADHQIFANWPCVVCEQPGGQVYEHFPPQAFLKRSLGLKGSELAHWAFLFRIHKRCHKKYSEWVHIHHRDRLPRVRVTGSVIRPRDLESRRSVLKVAVWWRARQFYMAVDRGDLSGALESIASAIAIWKHYTHEYRALRSISGATRRKPSVRTVKGRKSRPSR